MLLLYIVWYMPQDVSRRCKVESQLGTIIAASWYQGLKLPLAPMMYIQSDILDQPNLQAYDAYIQMVGYS